MFQHLICRKIFCADPQDLCFNPEQNIFCHQNYLLLMFPGESRAYFQNPVIRLLRRQIFRELYIHIVLLYPEPPAVFHLHAREKICLLPELFKTADTPAGVHSHFSLRFLEMIQFLDHHHRQNNLIVLKTFNGIGRLNQDIGIHHVNFYHIKFLSDFRFYQPGCCHIPHAVLLYLLYNIQKDFRIRELLNLRKAQRDRRTGFSVRRSFCPVQKIS